MQFLQEAHTPVVPTIGGGDLWYEADPQAPLAKDVCKPNIPPEKKEQDVDMQVEVEIDASQFTGLTTQQKLDTELNDLVENSDDDDRSSEKSMRTRRREERKKSRVHDDDRPHQYSKGIYARGSHEQPEQQAGDKRKFTSLQEPMSPESIRKSARKFIKESPNLFEWHVVSAFPKLFQYYRGERHLHAEKILENLRIVPEYHAPTLQVKADGNFRYVHVTEYNSRWLKKTKSQELKTTGL